jgi:hypothetical protein
VFYYTQNANETCHVITAKFPSEEQARLFVESSEISGWEWNGRRVTLRCAHYQQAYRALWMLSLNDWPINTPNSLLPPDEVFA